MSMGRGMGRGGGQGMGRGMGRGGGQGMGRGMGRGGGQGMGRGQGRGLRCGYGPGAGVVPGQGPVAPPVAPALTNDTRGDRPASLPSGERAIAVVDAALCTGCGVCIGACAEDAISMNGSATVDPELCTGCGVCVAECPNQALQLGRRHLERGSAR
jgi:Pyruvate/2-oxoacid:ferredoxin oxidoreductase delta subunit